MPKQSSRSNVESRFQITAKGTDQVDVFLYGYIGDAGPYGSTWIDAAELIQGMQGIEAKRLSVRINSYGGNVHDGLSIHNEIRRIADRGTEVTVTVDGLAASAASLIAMAGDTVVMPENALMMLHAPMGGFLVQGNARDLRDGADDAIRVLEVTGRALATSYARKTGRPASEFEAMWESGEDYWYTAAEAKAAGLCDVIAEENEMRALAHVAQATILADRYFRETTKPMPERIAASLRAFQTSSGEGRGEPAMSQSQTPTITTAQREDIVAAERGRVAEIKAMAASSLPVLGNLADEAITSGMTSEAFGTRALQVLAQGAEPLNGNARVIAGGSTGTVLNKGAEFRAAASDMLAMRIGVPIDKPAPGSRDIRNMSIVDIARTCLSRHDLDASMSASGVIRAALSTSDFPAILGDTMNKSLRKGYEDEPGTHSAWVRRSTVADFKPQSRVILGSMPDLLFVAEGAEYKYGAMDEDKSVPFSVSKYGIIIPITWEALVNDDLDALGRIPQGLGQAARRKEADLVYSLFEGSGQVMQDSIALFHADHGNLASSSADLDRDALAKGRLLLRKQLAVGGGALNLTPKTLLVPPELESDAEEILAASSIHVSAGLENATPKWIQRLDLVVESRLPAGAAYLLASNAQIDTAELAYLDEDKGPIVEEEKEFDRDVKKFKVRSVMGARALDWRGFVKLPIA